MTRLPATQKKATGYAAAGFRVYPVNSVDGAFDRELNASVEHVSSIDFGYTSSLSM